MRRLCKIIFLLGVFLAGYYLGHLPDSPDVFGQAEDLYHRADRTATQIRTRAAQEDVSWGEAALAYVFDQAAEGSGP